MPSRWRAAGFNSATSGQIRDHVLPNLSADRWTHIVLAIGTNDTKNFHSVPRFKKDFGGLLYALRAKWPEARVVWSPVLEFTRAPAMPPLLGRILEIRAGAMNRMGERLCLERGAAPAPRLPITDPQAGFSTDGFHASEVGLPCLGRASAGVWCWLTRSGPAGGLSPQSTGSAENAVSWPPQ